MTDFSTFSPTPSSPAQSVRAVTPDDDYDLPGGVCKSLLVGQSGNLEIFAEKDGDDQSVVIPVIAGQIVPIRVRRVGEYTTAVVFALY